MFGWTCSFCLYSIDDPYENSDERQPCQTAVLVRLEAIRLLIRAKSVFAPSGGDYCYNRVERIVASCEEAG